VRVSVVDPYWLVAMQIYVPLCSNSKDIFGGKRTDVFERSKLSLNILVKYDIRWE
jgi:hypothetical protein